jgi:hypothetical protein
MLKDRLVFTRKGWSVYNSEFIFDTLSFLLFFSLQIGLVYFGFIDSLLSLASIFIPYMGFFIIHKITKKYIYLFNSSFISSICYSCSVDESSVDICIMHNWFRSFFNLSTLLRYTISLFFPSSLNSIFIF